MLRLLLLGLNHTSAPLEVREKIAFNTAQQKEALDQFRARFPEAEAVLLSTCNRVELYAARATHGHPRTEEMSEFLANFHNIPLEQLRPHLYQKSEREVVDHLFSVASSLDSMVLGETQILGQVREAYDAARETSATGAMLNPLFQRALAVGKQVLHETALGEGRMSVASVAVDYARQIFDHFNDKTVLSIGAGKMATLALRHFAALNPKRLLICNRDPIKAEALAAQFHGQPVPFENIPDHLITADVVITSTGSREPIILKKQFDGLLKKRRYRPLFMIDIALPRDIEQGVGDFENVYLYNLDDLQQVVSATQSQRKDSLDAAKKIVTAQVDEFVVAHRARELGPVIETLQKRYHAMAREELQRTLAKFPTISDSEKSHLEELTRRIVNKLLHDPIQALRKSDSHTAEGPYLHAMEKLFHLEEDDTRGRSE